jgi:hypothetical protein
MRQLPSKWRHLEGDSLWRFGFFELFTFQCWFKGSFTPRSCQLASTPDWWADMRGLGFLRLVCLPWYSYSSCIIQGCICPWSKVQLILLVDTKRQKKHVKWMLLEQGNADHRCNFKSTDVCLAYERVRNIETAVKNGLLMLAVDVPNTV